jgi:hypothetical protein
LWESKEHRLSGVPVVRDAADVIFGWQSGVTECVCLRKHDEPRPESGCNIPEPCVWRNPSRWCETTRTERDWRVGIPPAEAGLRVRGSGHIRDASCSTVSLRVFGVYRGIRGSRKRGDSQTPGEVQRARGVATGRCAFGQVFACNVEGVQVRAIDGSEHRMWPSGCVVACCERGRCRTDIGTSKTRTTDGGCPRGVISTSHRGGRFWVPEAELGDRQRRGGQAQRPAKRQLEENVATTSTAFGSTCRKSPPYSRTFVCVGGERRR